MTRQKSTYYDFIEFHDILPFWENVGEKFISSLNKTQTVLILIFNATMVYMFRTSMLW